MTKPAFSFQDLRTHNNIVYPTYQEYAAAIGLFASETEGEYALMEAIAALKTPYQLHVFFVHLLVNDCLEQHADMWSKYQDSLSYDYYLENSANSVLAKELCLRHISQLLEEFGLHLSRFGIEEPVEYTDEVLHEIGRWSAHTEELMAEVESAYQSFTVEQRFVFKEFHNPIHNGMPLYIFLDGKAGRGKTFLIHTIVNYVRSIGKVAVVTATSAFAALLYPGGRTAHSAFKVPVQENNELLVAEVEYNSPRADLLQEASVIFWDEAPMANCAVLECVDILLRNICQRDEPFGGKFLPVRVIFGKHVLSSFLWESFQIRRLTIPIRNASDPEFASYVDSVGDGAGPYIPLPCLDNLTLYLFQYLLSYVFSSRKGPLKECRVLLVALYYGKDCLRYIAGIPSSYYCTTPDPYAQFGPYFSYLVVVKIIA
ncbi:hypothetical protein M422DRAFT_251221 [Sphaerobolus stellatus SS14]|uniref:ATP-dependent DNA helicase n=1 Tax=Sphaerobolus stellatus (strain SS14) TaxID=990650 RepID=A0A0C9VEN3_SPHS4|nr:hypothetical protein M422DRAFT_251221 [Sphaerobolus stellatus SS14]